MFIIFLNRQGCKLFDWSTEDDDDDDAKVTETPMMMNRVLFRLQQSWSRSSSCCELYLAQWRMGDRVELNWNEMKLELR